MIWSFGCILYEIKYKKPLFKSKNSDILKIDFVTTIGFPNDKIILDKIKNNFNGVYIIDNDENKTICDDDELNNLLINKCLCWNSNNRTSSLELLVDDYFQN